MKLEIIKEIVLPEGVTVDLAEKTLTVKGQSGEISRVFNSPKIDLEVINDKITLKSLKATKREKKLVGSFNAHIKNMVKGVVEPHTYKLKICSGHFPMNVSVSGQELTIKNFLGETTPRKVTFKPGVIVKIEGTEIVVSSPDKELAGMTAARIENSCKIVNKDIRIFMDGIWMIDKAGKMI
jgi:large subunit ribosomal protein L6